MTFPPQTGQFGFFSELLDTPLCGSSREAAVLCDKGHQTLESGYFSRYLGLKKSWWTMITRLFGVSFLKEVLNKLCPVIHLEDFGKSFFSLFTSLEVSYLCGKRAGSFLTVICQIWTNWVLKSIPENSAALLCLSWHNKKISTFKWQWQSYKCSGTYFVVSWS